MINESVCQIAIEEEHVIKVKSCCNRDWEKSSDDDELESNLGGDCFVSEGSEIGRNLKIYGSVREETTVEEVKELICCESRRPHIATEDMGVDVEGQHLSGLQKTRCLNKAIDELGGQFGCFNEVIDELEEEPRQFHVAIKEAGGQMQTLTKRKSLNVHIGPFKCDCAQFQVLERGLCLAGTGPIISESEFSRVGSRVDVALGCTNRATHLSHPLASLLPPHTT
ncbi:hypothetical protein VNO80_23194 [Phaseolus coccineus]|uniref:Uncharacterized protein n=1 Tax=Phaseolus coccineus TaxID=3886 RepID=A0AAN9QVL6_PHACN